MDISKVPRYMRAANAEHAERFRARTAAGHYNLSKSEEWWRDRNHIIEDHGYQLRSRLRPGWTPSWQDTDVNPLYCEDSLTGCTPKVVDAVRKSDGKDVAIMNLGRESREREILKYIAEAQRTTGEDHHIAPLLDSFEDDREPTLEFFVMPLLRLYFHPPFEFVPEVIDLFVQLLEGLSFMHQVGVAHRDCSNGNIMMEAQSIFPKGFHPCNVAKDRSGRYPIETIPRFKAAAPVNYYFIDFGISRRYEPGDDHLVVGDDGADRDVPEMSNVKFYDPFPADVFILGNVIKKSFLQKYKNLSFLSPLVDAMTATVPAERPTAEEALKRMKSIASSQSYFTLHRRLVALDETRGYKSAVIENFGIFISAVLVPVRFAFGIPSQTVSAVRGFIGSKDKKKKTS